MHRVVQGRGCRENLPREPGRAQLHCVFLEGLGSGLRESWQMRGQHGPVSGWRVGVQRGRRGAPAASPLEKLSLGMAMGHAPASPESLTTNVYPDLLHEAWDRE